MWLAKDLTLKWEKIIVWSPNWRVNISRRVTPHWFTQLNLNEYFYNAWQKKWDTHLREWRSFFDIHICLVSFWKIEISPTHSRNLKYSSVQVNRPRPTRLSNTCHQEIPKSTICKKKYDWSPNGKERILTTNRLLALRKEIHDRQKIQDYTNGTKLKVLVTWLTSYPTRQEHRSLDECMEYYVNRYSIISYGSLWFFVLMLWCFPY